MTKLLEQLKGKKTFLVSGTTIAYAVIVVGWGTGDWASANQMVLAALGLAGLRDAIK